MDEKQAAEMLTKDLEQLLGGETATGESGSDGYRQILALARRLAGMDFSQGYRRKLAVREQIQDMAKEQLPRQADRKAAFHRLNRAANLAAGALLLAGMVIGLSLLLRILLPGTSGAPLAGSTGGTPALSGNQTERITIQEARIKIREWYLAQDPGFDPQAELLLEELTTPELWKRLGVQLFQVKHGTFSYHTFLIHAGKVLQMSTGFGDSGIYSIVVSDLDGDGSPELAFSHAFVSRYHQTKIGLYEPRDEIIFDAGIILTDGNLLLEKVSEADVHVIASTVGGEKQHHVGALIYRSGEGEPALSVALDSWLSPELLQSLGIAVAVNPTLSSTSMPMPTEALEPTATLEPTLMSGPTPTSEPTATQESPTAQPTATHEPSPALESTTAVEITETAALTPTLALASALDLALSPEDMGDGWLLDADVNDMDAKYFLDRDGGKAVIWTQRKGQSYWYDPALVESVSLRGFRHPEQSWVLFQVVIVFKETAQVEEVFKDFQPGCDLPCEEVTEYEDGSGERMNFRDPEVGDESILLSMWDLTNAERYATHLLLRKDRVLVVVFSTAFGYYEPDIWPVVDEAQIEALARGLEARIP